MTSLSFPDLNVWLALAVSTHSHFTQATEWWAQYNGSIAFSRQTEHGFLRLLTTAAAMGGKPLSNDEAWHLYDDIYEDSRVVFVPEPPGTERFFRNQSAYPLSAPKLWADAWLLAFAQATGGTVITFDRALAQRGAHCLL
jgi:uncharacterized protein